MGEEDHAFISKHKLAKKHKSPPEQNTTNKMSPEKKKKNLYEKNKMKAITLVLYLRHKKGTPPVTKRCKEYINETKTEKIRRK